MDQNHEAMDSMADWAVKHWDEVRCTADPCKCGQVACPHASACHTPEDDQSDSADGKVLLYIIRVMLFLMGVGFIAWLLDELVGRL